jgi:hypothetical protein
VRRLCRLEDDERTSALPPPQQGLQARARFTAVGDEGVFRKPELPSAKECCMKSSAGLPALLIEYFGQLTQADGGSRAC